MTLHEVQGEGLGLQVTPGANPDTAALAVSNGPDGDQPPAPFGVNEVTTPSGLSIYYQAGPKRLYRIGVPRSLQKDGLCCGDCERCPEVWWEEVPSVSNILGCLDKPGLVWWGQRVGVEGVLELVGRDVIKFQDGLCFEYYSETLLGVEDVVEFLKQHKLTTNHQRDKAGDRGTSIHDALETWAQTGRIPAPNVYPEEERGYIRALNDFIIDSGVEPKASEVMVASAEHGYAGRYDLLGTIPHGADVVVKTFPKRNPVREKIDGGVWLLDLKTSKSVHDTHFLQLEAYNHASGECGYAVGDYRGVIHLCPDGRYELVESRATFDDFLAVLGAYKAMERMKARK